VDRPAVRRSLTHLEIAFGPDLSAEEKRALTRRMFRATGRNLVDLFRLARRGPAEAETLVRFEGLEHLDAALAKGRGVVALSAHLGNWEVLGAALAARGYTVSVLAREIFDPSSDRLLNEWRRRLGLSVYRRRGGLLPVVRALRSGGIVGTLVDQDTEGPGMFVEFFGRPAKTPIAPFILARRSGAALVPMWIFREPTGRHRVRILPEMAEPETTDPREALQRTIGAWHRILEAAIREHPEQWVWHHRRWKSRPTGEIPDLRTFWRERTYLAPFQSSSRMVSVR
jgi:KDO2-lipid IV(A) lauroyltransferase